MKQHVGETEIRNFFRNFFRKNAKACLQIKKSYLMPPSKHDHFHPILSLTVKIVELLQQHANTTVH